MWRAFWSWYERTYTLNISIALTLFLLQIVHLVWLFGAVVWTKLFGAPLFEFGAIHNFLIAVVDYTEIPAFISVSLIYINELRKGWDTKSVLYLALLNSQWLHLFWITDEIVVATLSGTVLVAIPAWLAWIAIGIDYLEVPVMVDMLMRFSRSIREKRVGEFLKTVRH